MRSGLRQFFSEHVDLRVAGEAASGREAIELVRTTELDVLVMDLSMPGQSGIDALAMIRAKAPDVEAWLDHVLARAGVFLVPGTVFGENGRGYVRASLCAPVERIEEAARRIEELS